MSVRPRLILIEEDETGKASDASGVFRAGQRPLPGLYRQIDGPRTVEIAAEGDRLPPSFDGRVALYRRVERLWGQIQTPELKRAA